MKGRTTLVAWGAVALLGIIAAALLLRSRTPTRIDVTGVPGTCIEGSSHPIKVTIRNASGDALEVTPTWSSHDEASVQGSTLRCRKEGDASLTVLVEKATTVIEVHVLPPLTGTWVRRGDDKAGMAVAISRERDGLAGYVVRGPGLEAVAYLRKAASTKVAPQEAESAATFAVECLQTHWVPGIKKWDAIQRATNDRWTMRDLSKEIALTPKCDAPNMALRRMMGQQECPRICKLGKSTYSTDYEMVLVSADRLEVRSTTTPAVIVWEREVVQVPARPITASSTRSTE